MSDPHGGGGGSGGMWLGIVVAIVVVLLLLSNTRCTLSLGGQDVGNSRFAPLSTRSTRDLANEAYRTLGAVPPGIDYHFNVTPHPSVSPRADCPIIGREVSADGRYTFVRRICE